MRPVMGVLALVGFLLLHTACGPVGCDGLDETNPGHGASCDKDGVGATGDTYVDGGDTLDTQDSDDVGDSGDSGDTGDSGDSGMPVDTDPPPPVPTSSADLRATGSLTVTSSSGTLQTTSGCALSWQHFVPDGGSTAPLVVLTHGLQRSEAQMTTWAAHLASWGLEVVTPTSCHASIIDLDQEQNGLDLIELAAATRAGPVIYAGHSAGGLASWVAASRDANAVGLFGLDPVEFNTLGATASPDIGVRTYAVTGDDSTCNGFGNQPALIDAVAGSTRLYVVDADHCDFEVPTGPLCTLVCGRSTNARFTEVEIRDTVRGLLTSALLDLAGLDPTAAATWWTPGGACFDWMETTGRVR